MAITLVQLVAANTLTVNLPGATTPGNFLACVMAHRDSGGVSTGPTSAHGTWALAVAVPHPTENTTIELWYRANLTGVTTAVTLPTLTRPRTYVLEYSGMGHAQVVDKIAGSVGAGTLVASGTTAVTTKPEELWIAGLLTSHGGDTYSAPTNSFTIRAQGDTGGGAAHGTSAVLDRFATAVGASSTAATIGTSDDWIGLIATFAALATESLTATVPAASTMTGTLLAIDQLNGAVPAASTVSGEIHPRRNLTTTVPAVSTVAATLTRRRPLTTTVPAVSTVTASLTDVSSELVVLAVETDDGAAEIEETGGWPVTLVGTFPTGVPLAVYMGPVGNETDPPATSGIAGQGNVIVARRPDRVRVYSPVLPPGVYRIHAVSPNDSFTLLAALTVRPRQFRSTVYGLRRTLPPRWLIGARGIDQEDPT